MSGTLIVVLNALVLIGALASAVVAVQYIVTGGNTYEGNGIITGYSESSSAELDSDTTLSLDIKIIGGFAVAA